MATIIMYVITFVMSISMFFTNAVPAYISGENYKIIPNNAITVEEEGYGLIPTEERICYEIVSDYDEWKEYSEKNNCEVSSYNEEYFETKSLVLAEFVINDALCELQVVNAAERNNKLELSCNIYHHYGISVNYVTFCTLTVETSKNIETVDISTNSMNIPFHRL